MRINNMLHFTENHRYCVYRDFGLSAVDGRMLSLVYQPMAGAFAIGFYRLLAERVSLEQVGYSPIEQQRELFLTLGLEPSEKGRKYLIEQASKLEAVGLLQTSRLYIPERDDYIYEYELQAPLSPADFFRTQHLTLLLRDKIGKFAVLALRERMFCEEPPEWTGMAYNKENISVPFYDIFELNTHAIDYELEQAIAESSMSRQSGGLQGAEEEAINYADIIIRFPRESANRAFVEGLRFNSEGMGIANYVARKYELSVQDLCRLLDEDGVFAPDGSLLLESLQHKANLHFRQGKRRRDEREVAYAKVVALRASETAAGEGMPEEVAVQMEYYVEVPPQFRSKCDIHQYNMMLRNEPYTRLLKTFFPGSVPDNLLDIFEKIDLNYKLPGEVINVLIHYLMEMLTSGGEQRINRNFVDAIAANMLLKRIDSYEKAVQYIRNQAKVRKEKSSGAAPQAAAGRSRAYGRTGTVKPDIPIVESSANGDAVTEEEFAELLKMAEQMQASKQNKASK
ncbi:helicase DnaB [Paenibacillus woosongensis]|uniref:Helicase DnaB n=1 Tax=Paenibacillus woosongensis TaxID=307580 RepID=A0AA95I605_9BACL|nr:helicase DnaB [Paenibacillus woosongensis]WHX48304.1 helicase DnaB [Paenibacillus woosongensis]GIP59992.1 replication initiation protein [Paenibacillus woosongensis]